MTSEAIAHDAAHPVPDRFQPPDLGELAELTKVMRDGRLSGGAEIVTQYETALATWFGARYAVAVNSGSSALHAVLHVLGARPGAEVLVPAVAPIVTALPIMTTGATPVIVDVLPDSLVLDPDDVRRKLTKHTRAAISVPLWGYPADCREAARVLAEAGVPLIEDAAQAHGTRHAGQFAGTLGAFGCFSTHDRKLVSTGEGGFILTNSLELHRTVEHFTRLGHLRSDTHGVNYKLAAPLAAIGLRRLAYLPEQLAARRANARRILAALPGDSRVAELPYALDATPNYYNLVLITRAPERRITSRLVAAGLPPDSVRYGYRPLQDQPLFARWSTPCRNARALTSATIQIPVHPGMSESTLEWVARCVSEIADPESERS